MQSKTYRTLSSGHGGGVMDTLKGLITAFTRHRFLISQLIKVNLLGDFKKSFIGATWLFILPLLSVVTWALLHNAGVLQPGENDIPYVAYVLLSTSIWTFFIGIYKMLGRLINSNGRLMIMVRFPVEVLVFEKLAIHFIQFFILLVINVIALYVLGVDLPWIGIIFPFLLLPLVLLGAAIGLIGALVKVVAVDIGRLMDSLMGFLMFVTPIIYTPKVNIGFLSKIIPYNPLTYLIGVPRDILTTGTTNHWMAFTICSTMSVILFVIALHIFLQSSPRTVERIINT